MPVGRDHQDIARPDPVESIKHGAEIRGLAQSRYRPAKKPGLPPWRIERTDIGIDLALIAKEIDRDGDRHGAPGVKLGTRQFEWGQGMDRDGHMSSSVIIGDNRSLV
jgi:hypothetical protein